MAKIMKFEPDLIFSIGYLRSPIADMAEIYRRPQWQHGITYCWFLHSGETIANITSAYSMLRKFVPLLLSGIASGRRILIHCQTGNDYAPLLLASALIYRYGYTVIQVMDHLRAHRPCVQLNTSFVRVLSLQFTMQAQGKDAKALFADSLAQKICG